jgi:hypothetical protein
MTSSHVMTDMTLEEAAIALNTSAAALWQRIHRAKKNRDAHGVDVDLGHGVTGFMPNFRRAWTISIPNKMLKEKTKKSKKRAKR